MKIPYTINSNIFDVYDASPVALSFVIEANRHIKSEDRKWDESEMPKLSELCVLAIVANFENRVILNELPCWDRNQLLEILPTDLPLPLAVKYIQDEIYWKRRVADRWKDESNYCGDYGFSWKRMYLERHVQEAVEAMTPEGFDPDAVAELCNLTKDHVKRLNLRELQIMQPLVIVEEEDEFTVAPEPSDHIDLCPVILGLTNLTELHVQFGLRNVGSDYKKSWFQFSAQDCRNLGTGVARAGNLRLLRVHSCCLDDEKLIILLSSMDGNESLEEIDFSNCTFGDYGATGVARFLKNRSKVRRVVLSNNKIMEEGVSALAFIVTQSGSSPVEHLNLKFNMFGDAGFKYMASALVREKTKIKELNVSCCGLMEESGILLAEALNRNPILTDVDVSNNHLGESAGRALENALRTNRTIQFLDLRMTEISEDDFLAIDEALFFNRIRAAKGEAGVERELRLRERRAEAERRRLEEEELAAARAAEEAARQAEKDAKAEPAVQDD